MPSKQKTIACAIGIEGIGLHSGEKVKIKVKPADIDTGIVFKRTDLEGSPTMRASYENVKGTFLCTTLKSKFKIVTLEHLMSALAGLGIDNIIVESNSDEMPIMDGSARAFVFILQSAGIVEQNKNKNYLKIKKEVVVEVDGAYIKIAPYNGFKINFQLEYQHPAFHESIMQYSIDLNKSCFSSDIAPARTYGFYPDFAMLKTKNLIRGGSLSNAIVFDEQSLLNADGLRFENECVRHKILDVIGDFYLLGYPMLAELTCFKSGHTLNNLAVRKIMSESICYDLVE